MKNGILKSIVFAAVSYSLVGCAWFSGQSTPLRRAHESFLGGRFQAMAAHLKEVFEDSSSDDVTRRNALELLHKAYAAKNGGSIPVDWKLPKEIEDMKINVRHARKPERDTYVLKASGTGSDKGIVAQIQIVQYPDRIVLDKEAGLGEWTESYDPEDGHYFELDGDSQAEPPAEGLYLLNLRLRDGRVTKGWFILSDLVSSETPTVRTPAVGEQFSTRNPTFRWLDFHSPEFQSHERRTLWVGISAPKPPDFTYNEVWSRYEANPATTETTIGVDPLGKGLKELPDGRYVTHIGYKEIRRFGDLRLARQSMTILPFSVRGK